MTLPLVSVVIPARDEERDIADCLRAIAAQTYPLDRIEVIVVDGLSVDRTSEAAQAAATDLGLNRLHVVVNPRRTTPSSLNLGLRQSDGEVICRVDARSRIPRKYVERCVELLGDPRNRVVGGSQIAVARHGAGRVERGIARALRNRYFTGLSTYRRGRVSGPSDTVYLGAFRRADLLTAGGWDEQLLTNQDYELNRRMARGGHVWFCSELAVEYRPRPTLSALAAQYRRFGRWKSATWLEGKVAVAPRQVGLLLVPPIVAMTLLFLARRRPGGLVLAISAAALGLEVGGQRESASLSERMAALAAAVVLSGAWWVGAVEQTARRMRGERLVGGSVTVAGS